MNKILIIEDRAFPVFGINRALQSIPDCEIEIPPNFDPLPWDQDMLEKQCEKEDWSFPEEPEIVHLINQSNAQLVLLDFNLGTYTSAGKVLQACISSGKKIIGIGLENKFKKFPHFGNKDSLNPQHDPKEVREFIEMVRKELGIQ